MAKTASWDNKENEVTSNWMKFNVPLEDKIHGTYIRKSQMKSNLPGKEGQLVNNYEIKADEASSFHALDDTKKVIAEPVQIKVGDIYSIGGTAVIDRQMQNIKLGQVIGLKFIEEKASKTKGFAPAKIVKVYAPKDGEGNPIMDKEFLEQKTLNDF
ncbi:MAG: hypothetical protein V4436_02105 [Patescibacteria group bacterium]